MLDVFPYIVRIVPVEQPTAVGMERRYRAVGLRALYTQHERRQKITNPGSSPRDAQATVHPQDQRCTKKAFWRGVFTCVGGCKSAPKSYFERAWPKTTHARTPPMETGKLEASHMVGTAPLLVVQQSSRSPQAWGSRTTLRGAQGRLKDDLRRRCLARVAQQRAAQVSKHRFSPPSVRADVALAAEGFRMDSGGASAWSEEDEARLQEQLGHEGYLELMATMDDSLLRELQRDVDSLADGASSGGEAAAREYEAFLAAEESRALAAAAEEEGDEGVACPVCVAASLQLDASGWVTCRAACGLRLDARGAQSSPLEAIRSRMCELISGHGQHCAGRAFCRLPSTFEQPHLGSLAFCCTTCGTAIRVV